MSFYFFLDKYITASLALIVEFYINYGILMKKKTTTELRSAFLDYFVQHNHTALPSSSLIPHNDPSLLFTTAGMVQFKDIFTGKEKTNLERVTTSQKCIRAGGKHNDLEQVGYTARHHTFFEMLGNFSFGNYFKDLAIEFAWNFLTKELGINKDRLLVTVYSEDLETEQLWKKIANLPEDKIIRISTADNFWSMGNEGPCGPCTEIFYDHGEYIPGGPPGSPDEDGDRFVEIWNLVFMQYEKFPTGDRINLPKPSVDTGMSLERLTAVLQGVSNNYDIDLFQSIIHSTAEIANVEPSGKYTAPLRIIADHLRSACFLIADGVLPAAEGRGYVLRRIMRRAMRHIHEIAPQDILMYKIVPTLTSLMGGAFPELIRAQTLIQQTLKTEEIRFRKTLDHGLKLLESEMTGLPKGGIFSGLTAFKLYDTFGFPFDLTQDILKKSSITIDKKAFSAAMDEQKTKARAAWKGSGEQATDEIWYELREKFGLSDFIGYDTLKSEGRALSIVRKTACQETLPEGAEGWLLTNQTPFYGESGGQSGDKGIIETKGGAYLIVSDTKKVLSDLIVHRVKVEKGTLKKGDDLILTVDPERREKLKANHSATHLLHESLRRRLGNHIMQKGSLVEADKLRFDFSHSSPLLDIDIQALEKDINKQIRSNHKVVTSIVSPDDAKKAGAMALFDEKYGNLVRMVSMGNPSDNTLYSIELCGGTHVNYTGDIGFFKIISDSSVSAGVRRIEAVTGDIALKHVQENFKYLEHATSLLRIKPSQLGEKVSEIQSSLREKNKEIKKIKQKSLSNADNMIQEMKFGQVNLYLQQMKGVSPKELKALIDTLKAKNKNGVIGLFSEINEKVVCIIGVAAHLSSKINAVDLIKTITPILGGSGGGGRPDLAQGGGSDRRKIQAASALLQNLVKEKVKEATEPFQ